MLALGILALIIFWIVSAYRTREFDRRREYGKIIAQNIELDELFEEFYFGEYEFGEILPNENIRKQVEVRYDRGVETRLAFHFAEVLPKWVLLKAVNDINSNQFCLQETYGYNIRYQLYVFAKIRSQDLIQIIQPDHTKRERDEFSP